MKSASSRSAGAWPLAEALARRRTVARALALSGVPILMLVICLLSAIGGDAAARDPKSIALGIGPGLRLVMVDDAACIYCRKWDAEVGQIYERSAVGRIVPLERRVKRHKDLQPFEPLAYTPTFVLVRDGTEIGRIIGYAGPDFFWAELERLVASATATPDPPQPSPGPDSRQRDASLRADPAR